MQPVPTHSIGSQVQVLRSTDVRIRFLLLFYSWNHISTWCPTQSSESMIKLYQTYLEREVLAGQLSLKPEIKHVN